MAAEDTPMMKQYLRLKQENKDSVLFFRLGDFYEMFNSDAVEVSRILNLTLTKRHGTPMCGIPYHSASNYIGRLLNAGKKIAVCEQVSLPEKGKGIAEREVVEIITPGTIVDEKFLESASNNYLAALGKYKKSLSFSYVDLSTGEFKTTSFPWGERSDKVRKEIARITPREMIVQESLMEDSLLSDILNNSSLVVNRYPDWTFQLDTSFERLKKQFKVNSLKGFGFEEGDDSLLSPGVLLDYLEETSKSLLPHVRALEAYSDNDYLNLDESTQNNLEIIRNLKDNTKNYTLLDVLDYSKTPMGARLLRRWLTHPLKSLEDITLRQDRVEYLYMMQPLLSSLRDALSRILDLERLTARVAMDKAHAKDLVAVKNSLKEILAIDFLTEEWEGFSLFRDKEGFSVVTSLHDLLKRSLCEEPSILLTEGNLIREGYNGELDRYKTLKDQSKTILDAYLADEKERTGINNLKIKYNKILGYFFDITKSNLSAVPEEYIRRQSLVNSERFTTEKLSNLEVEINSAQTKVVELEKSLFLEVRAQVKEFLPLLQDVSALIAELDCFQSFAYSASVHNFVKPDMNGSTKIDIIQGRHPVVEVHLPPGEFVPNSIHIDSSDQAFALITGPNMAGKSTYLRQVALIVLMAQTGSFVPAESASIGVIDRIYCRVGASDNLARGESTFLVEMNETANILRTATDKSLVIMDEVGRGTSTNDGLSIAWAVCEYLLDTLKAKTLFATHYHELTDLKNERMFNLSMEVKEVGNDILFLKKVKEGATNNSYGIHVAKLAGIPQRVIERAETLLAHIENLHEDKPIEPPKASAPVMQGFELFPSEELIINSLKSLDINGITPMDALNFIHNWKKELV